MKEDAVVLMAYGSPASRDDVEAYYTHVRRGRRPTVRTNGRSLVR